MKKIVTLKKSSQSLWSFNLTIKSLLLSAFMILSFELTLSAQDGQKAEYSKPSWYFGVAGGNNFNYYRGSTQQLNAGFTSSVAFHNGFGTGLYLAPVIEYQRPNARFGFMLQAGYDSRKGKFNQVTTPCNCPADLSTKLSYFTIEPSLRFTPFKSVFYLYGGPRLAFNNNKSFTYKQGINPDFPNNVAPADVKGDFSSIDNTIVSMQIGAGFDIPLSSNHHKTQFVLSPFVAYQPYFGQYPRTIETWNLTTVRAGLVLKFGSGHKKVVPVEKLEAIIYPKVIFTVNSPENFSEVKRIIETFPIRNYIYFDNIETTIPNRYVLLKKDQVKDFKEDQVELFTPVDFSGRSKREMTVYYNVLNVLGVRMQTNPKTTITLVGSSVDGEKDALLMTTSVKDYLVTIFAIDATRIAIEGRTEPKIKGENLDRIHELGILGEGSRRVVIESHSPELLIEYRSDPNAPLKPVKIVIEPEAPIESYVTFHADKSDKSFNSWRLELTDEDGFIQNYGPYTQEEVSIPGETILGTKLQGNYNVAMIGTTKSDSIVKEETMVHMVLWQKSKIREAMKFSVIYEYDDATAVKIYEKYLSEVVSPKIKSGDKVIIHGFTDVIGEEAHNLSLSLARANDVKNILEISLLKSGTTNVEFEVGGYGEDIDLAPFENTYPEERAYNRTVIIEIIPKN